MFGQEGNPRHLRKDGAYGPPVASDRKIWITQDVVQVQAVGLAKGLLQKWLVDFEADEVVITVGSESALRNLHYVESELGTNVRTVVIFVGDVVAELSLQFGIVHRHCTIHRRMSVNVRCVVRERSQSKCIPVDVVSVPQHGADEISA